MHAMVQTISEERVPVSDAFFIAFKLPNLFRRLFAEGAFNTAFVPMFATALERDGHEVLLLDGHLAPVVQDQAGQRGVGGEEDRAGVERERADAVVELHPGNYMAFYEPWDNGDYDT